MCLEKVEKAYNKRDIVRNSIFPLEAIDLEFDKWSPNWEVPFIISQILPNGANQLVNFEGKELEWSINAK